VAAADGFPLLGRLAASISQFANKRGVYLGRRSTRIHVATYRRSVGRLGGHLPGWAKRASSYSITRAQGQA
jgi:hypothetical protein